MIKYLALLTIVIFMNSCFTVKPVDFFEVSAYARLPAEKHEEPLIIIINPLIQKLQLLNGTLIQFEDYRSSLKASLSNTLMRQFSNVSFTNESSGKGLELHVYRFEPRIEVHSFACTEDNSFPVHMGQLHYDASLSHDGNFLKNAIGCASSTVKSSNKNQYDQLALSAITKAIEQLTAELIVEGYDSSLNTYSN